MARKITSRGDVGALVEEILATLPRPLTEDITLDVANEIRDHRRWRTQYDQLVSQYGKAAVNQQLGRSTLQLTGRRNSGRRKKAINTLIDSYTLLE